MRRALVLDVVRNLEAHEVAHYWMGLALWIWARRTIHLRYSGRPGNSTWRSTGRQVKNTYRIFILHVKILAPLKTKERDIVSDIIHICPEINAVSYLEFIRVSDRGAQVLLVPMSVKMFLRLAAWRFRSRMWVNYASFN